MSSFHSFEEIEAWQEGRKLVRSIRAICKRPTMSKDFALVDQLTRAARSICANIAEGNDSLTTPDFINYLGHAKKSAAEVRSHLYDVLDEEYVPQIEFAELVEQTKKISRMISALITYLQSIDQKRKRNISTNSGDESETCKPETCKPET